MLHGLLTGSTPRRPHIDQEDFSGLVLEGDLALFEDLAEVVVFGEFLALSQDEVEAEVVLEGLGELAELVEVLD